MKTIYAITLDLCFAHRIWDHQYSDSPFCRFIHGHTSQLEIELEYDQVQTPHKDILAASTCIKDFFKKEINSRFLIDSADPMFYTLVNSMYESLAREANIDLYTTGVSLYSPIYVPSSNEIGAYKVNLGPVINYRGSPVFDILESYVILEFCPGTANICTWVKSLVEKKFDKYPDVVVKSVMMFEAGKMKGGIST